MGFLYPGRNQFGIRIIKSKWSNRLLEDPLEYALIFMDPTLGEQVDEEILSREGISTTGRSVLQDIQAYENILKNPLSYVDRGLLALKYRVCSTT